MEKWGTPTTGVSLTDQACASFFLSASIIFGVGNRAIKERDIQKELKPCQDAATLCREALFFPHRSANDPDLAGALSASATYFEEWIKIITNANMNSPYLVERATGDHDDMKWPRAAGPFLGAVKLEGRLLVVLYQAAKGSVCC